MGRLIIDNRAEIPDEQACYCAAVVIAAGRISNDGKQYAYATRLNSPPVMVYSDLNKASDRLVIMDDRDYG